MEQNDQKDAEADGNVGGSEPGDATRTAECAFTSGKM